MRDQPPTDASVEKKPSDGQISMNEIWAEAAKAFESICGESLQRGDVRGFDDVQKKIEDAGKAAYSDDAPDSKLEKAKSVGFKSLKYLKMLVGAATQAASVVPIPASAAYITGNALCFVFDISEAIKGYNDAIDQVFTEVSSSLSQFQIYTNMSSVDPLLVQRIHYVMVSFVKICAHVVKYRQGRRWERILRQIKPIFDEDSGLSDEMTEFKRALQQQRDIEGTITLAMVVDSRRELAMLLEQSIIYGKTAEETHQVVQDTQKGVQALKDDADRIKTLIRIRDVLSVPPTVRLDANTTQTCTNISQKCLPGTGSWIWTHDAYVDWTASGRDKKALSNCLILSGPQSSGKTSVSALITNRLEEMKGRTYVAHYFFPASSKKSDDEKSTVQSALKYMAFQIARVDATTRKALGKACEAGPSLFRRSGSLYSLWEELKIGAPGSSATYYFVFDGLENLPEKEAEALLMFCFESRVQSSGGVRILVSGSDDYLQRLGVTADVGKALRIRMEEHNEPDMRIMIDDELTEKKMLQHAKPNSEQQKARDKIVERLPQNVSGSYSRLRFGLDDVIRLLSTRTTVQELDEMLNQSMSSHEAAIKNLQRSLTTEEILELNELLKWVLYGDGPMRLEELEGAMFLYSGAESLASLDYIIKNKYSAVLKVEDIYVLPQDGVVEYLQERGDASNNSFNKDRPTISMTINIHNVDQEICGHFLWDLAHKAIRDRFKFDFDTASPHGGLHSSSQANIAVNEFEAHHTFVTRAFEYFDKDPVDQTFLIGTYHVCFLPFHLNRLRELEDEDKGALTPNEQMEIGQGLYKLFKDDEIFQRHKAVFGADRIFWLSEEIECLQNYLMDSGVVRRLNKKWRDEVKLAVTPARGFLRPLVRTILEDFLRGRSWNPRNGSHWIAEIMKNDEKKLQKVDVGPIPPSPPSAESYADIDWERMSTWCLEFLQLEDVDSLWLERLAEAASVQNSNNPSIVTSLYERAIERGNHSWLCRRGLAEAHHAQGDKKTAMAQIELALEEAEKEDANPKPERNDIDDLHLRLGNHAYEASVGPRAIEHFLVACKSENQEYAKQAQLGYLRAMLSFSEAEATRQLLRKILAGSGWEGEMVGMLRMIAKSINHDSIMLKMFTILKEDPVLLKDIVGAMETATSKPALDEVSNTELVGDDRLAEREVRGVLLFDRGFAAYRYNISPDGTEAVEEALRLWKESRELLTNVGGGNAFLARLKATTALAHHYFHKMLRGKNMSHIDALTKLAEEDSDNPRGDAHGFLGVLYTLHDDKEKSRAALVDRIRAALYILSDGIPENDTMGYSILQQTLEQYHDFKQAAVASSLVGQPDLVTNALLFEAEDIVGYDSERQAQILEKTIELSSETIRAAKAKVPDFSQQAQRISAAMAYAESHVVAEETRLKAEVKRNKTEVPEGPPQKDESAFDSNVLNAWGLISQSLELLQQRHGTEIDTQDLQWHWTCDGRTPDGNYCENGSDFGSDFYHCIYCSNQDFCRDCLPRVRNPNSGVEITACSPHHRWLRIPPFGGEWYVGMRSKTARVPKEVRPSPDDERIIEFIYGDDGDMEEISVEAWKESIAKEWDISLDEIKKQVSGQDAPDVEDENAEKDLDEENKGSMEEK